jgi:membrane protease YdiL (CAAX protease family)
VTSDDSPDLPAVRPVQLLHQEGVLGLVAIAGLALRDGGSPATGLTPVGPLWLSVAAGLALAAGSSLLLLLARGLPALARLERFQARLVRGWTVSDALAVAVLSGLAEEALLRALLQPLLGLLPAAILFAVLHLVPDARLWMWPAIALALGVVLGLAFDRFGYPAAAAAHVAINAIALLRLRRLTVGSVDV